GAGMRGGPLPRTSRSLPPRTKDGADDGETGERGRGGSCPVHGDRRAAPFAVHDEGDGTQRATSSTPAGSSRSGDSARASEVKAARSEKRGPIMTNSGSTATSD